MLRDLSVSLNKVGDATAPWAGWRTPSAPTPKPQAVSRVLRERLGDAPVLRDLEHFAGAGGRRRSALSRRRRR